MKVTDPVCGMRIEQEDAVATARHERETYYFCSEDCKETSEENPEDYIDED